MWGFLAMAAGLVSWIAGYGALGGILMLCGFISFIAGRFN